MSIERQLIEEFERDSRKCPSDLDTRIAAEYKHRVMQQRGIPFMFRKRRMPKVVLIAVIFIVICGFGYAGNKLLFEDQKEKLSISYQTEQQLHFEKGDVGKIRSSFQEVKAQLKPGDTAVVYLQDYDIQVQGTPIVFGINKPVSIPLEAWKATLQQRSIKEKLPESILGTYKFVEGMETSPYQFNYGPDAYRLIDEMKAESKETGSKVLWRITNLSEADPVAPYTSVYRNSANDTIYLTWQIAGGDTSVKMFQAAPLGTAYEEIDIGGLTAHYMKDDHSLYGQSTIHQDVMWLKESGGKTIVYHVQTDSQNMTKEQLVEAAKSLL
ncbi:hypothetical protein [Paenibacillus rhizophilus]|uniref:DUF4367 domain-containing protein n=1 Tax=Paenibacillus rhizophilus TaxID=1850366 RepID=A0A3N9PA83_9BACL|nr:hypothetical protein [Paenibacillus rhizophilus]RQW11954.1 hypothetical protein EH198_09815 [Paenibacillus rhizophilus]